MTKLQRQVLEFMTVFGQPAALKEGLPSAEAFALGNNLIAEEFDELQTAQTLEARKDALGDLLYVVYWMSNAHGIDMEPVTNEIHRSNLTKMWTDAEVEDLPDSLTILKSLERGERRHVVIRIKDGKVIKSPSYEPVNLLPEAALAGLVVQIVSEEFQVRAQDILATRKELPKSSWGLTDARQAAMELCREFLIHRYPNGVGAQTAVARLFNRHPNYAHWAITARTKAENEDKFRMRVAYARERLRAALCGRVL